MAQSAGATVDQHDDLVFLEPVGLAYARIEDVGHALDLEEVVPRAQRADLVLPAVFRFLADLIRIRALAHPFVLAVQEVVLDGVAVLERPVDAAGEDFVDRIDAGFDDAAPPRPDGMLANSVDELLLVALHFVVGQVRPHHPDAAIDVIADRTRRNTAVLGVERAHPTDREAVSLMGVGHTDRVVGYSRQVRRVLICSRELSSLISSSSASLASTRAGTRMSPS